MAEEPSHKPLLPDNTFTRLLAAAVVSVTIAFFSWWATELLELGHRIDTVEATQPVLFNRQEALRDDLDNLQQRIIHGLLDGNSNSTD